MCGSALTPGVRIESWDTSLCGPVAEVAVGKDIKQCF